MELSINYRNNGVKNYVFYPESETDEILQNVGNILARLKGNVPLAREKGIGNVIDLPEQEAMIYIQMQIIQELEREEPRFRIKEINFDGSDFKNAQLSVNLTGEVGDVTML